MDPFTESIVGCARCLGDGHKDLEFRPLTNPVRHDGEVIGTHWATCPETGEPIISRMVPREDNSDYA